MKKQQKHIQEIQNERRYEDLEKPAEVLKAQDSSLNNHTDDEQIGSCKANLFFSFDIVNSTSYKTQNIKWPIIIKALLEDVRNQVLTSPDLSTSVLWRVIGDEMVFVLPIQTGLELPEKIDAIFDVLQRISISLRRGVFFDGLVGQAITKTDISMMKSQNILSMKATAWIALINDSVEIPFESISVSYYAADNRQIITDYLGQDIDTGFRLKSYTQDRRLVISYELAYLLNQNGKSGSMHIMDYVRLKGVWEGSLYPVIWYHNDDALATLIGDKTASQFAHSFRYDETDHNDLVNAYFKRGRNQKKKMNAVVDEDYLLADSMFDIKTAVNKICIDRNLEDKMKYLSEILEKPIFISNNQKVINTVSKSFR